MARYELNANGYRGWLELELGEDTCSGQLQYQVDPSGKAMGRPVDPLSDGTVSRSAAGNLKIIAIEFTRVSQRYHGWLSVDESMMGGYLVQDGVKVGWYAVKSS
ncbi:MAG: hypothetical protein AAGF11_43170 [Myxococcota bacterium]